MQHFVWCIGGKGGDTEMCILQDPIYPIYLLAFLLGSHSVHQVQKYQNQDEQVEYSS